MAIEDSARCHHTRACSRARDALKNVSWRKNIYCHVLDPWHNTSPSERPPEGVVASLVTYESPASIGRAAAAGRHAWDLAMFLGFTPRRSVKAATSDLDTAHGR